MNKKYINIIFGYPKIISKINIYNGFRAVRILNANL
jgi:hypothetical protein